MKKNNKRENAITLVVLVITIIILLILAGITISSLTKIGLSVKAKEAKEKAEQAQKNEQELLGQYIDELNKQTSDEKFEKTKGVNKPELMQGMKAIKFTAPSGDTEGTVQQVSDSTLTDWYDYGAKKWANAQTEDGSMWVWIPRYAYKIVYNDSSDKSKGGTLDIVFLIGTTDNYYDENGNLQTAQRQKSEDQIIETDSTKTDKYTVHPAFTNESSIGYANGGWNQELTGIWVAKFEAGYATSNGNSAPKKASSVKYSQDTVRGNSPETETGSIGTISARNWIDGVYGSTTTSIKYPTFQGLTYSMNYINHNDAFNISRALTENGNIYGLSNNTTDSHLMKNSEWGAVIYLSQSKYGLNDINITTNNININNTTKSVYAVTGCAGTTKGAYNTTISQINNRTLTDVYVWTQEKGTKASTTGTIYGIYDMAGGTLEKTASYVNNGHNNLKYGKDFTFQGVSTKYATVYPHDPEKDNNNSSIEIARIANYSKNVRIYGDAIRETSKSGEGNTEWNSKLSNFMGFSDMFLCRGGDCFTGTKSGLFYIINHNGTSGFHTGFRSVLVSI